MKLKNNFIIPPNRFSAKNLFVFSLWNGLELPPTHVSPAYVPRNVGIIIIRE